MCVRRDAKIGRGYAAFWSPRQWRTRIAVVRGAEKRVEAERHSGHA
jgi:hypothetical protein